jgi:hypothetical protein
MFKVATTKDKANKLERATWNVRGICLELEKREENKLCRNIFPRRGHMIK